MKSFLKKYKYIIFLIISITLFSFICFKKYDLIESHTASCSTNNMFTPTKYYNFEKITMDNTITSSIYGCSNNKLINFFTKDIDNNKILVEKTIDHDTTTGDNTHLEDCIQNVRNTADIVTINNNKCKAYDLNTRQKDITYTSDSNKIIYKCGTATISDRDIKNEDLINPASNTSNKENLQTIGSGVFTDKGYKTLKSSIDGNIAGALVDYNPVCSYQNSISNAANNLFNCNPGDENCFNDAITTIQDGVTSTDNILNNPKFLLAPLDTFFGGTSETTGSGESSEMITDFLDRAFEGDNLLNVIFNSINDNTIETNTINEIKDNLGTYKNILAESNESSLNTQSKFLQYLLFLVVLIITVIIIIISITNPDIISSEMLVGYIIFLALVLFVTSNYFNVDYGPLNKFLTLHLGNAGDRSVFVDNNYLDGSRIWNGYNAQL